MSDDKLGFLDEMSEEITETPEVEVEEPTAEEPQEVKAEEPETPAVEEAADTGEEEAAPPVAEVEEKPQAIPVTALLDEREKRQLAERKAEETAKRLADMEARIRASQQQQKAPDWDMEPQAAAQYQAQAFEQRMQAQRLEQSKFFASREFGNDTVNEAIAYFDQNPQLSHQFINEPSPFHAAVEFYQKQKFLSEVGENPDAYKDSLREQIRQELMAEMTTSSPSKPKAPPPSMAKAPSTGRDAITPGSTFDNMFS
jgi:hypothetical protein